MPLPKAPFLTLPFPGGRENITSPTERKKREDCYHSFDKRLVSC
jgi:hypothetical protein